MLYTTKYFSPIGEMLLVSNENDLLALSIKGQKYEYILEKQEVQEKEDIPILQKTKNWLDRYFQREKPKIEELSLSPIGNEFRQRVWKILCDIPYGETITYGEIAKKIAKQMNKKTMSAQAVGNAVGHNPISIIIPCHRVVGKNGNLTGYAGGIDKKIKLLQIENVDTEKLFVPKKERKWKD